MPRHTIYPPSSYDDNLVLKVPLLLWVAMFFLVRHFIFLGLTFLPRVGDAMSYLRDVVEPMFLIADLFAAPVLYIALRRKPGSPKWMRRLWNRGRAVLVASALIYAGLWIINFAIEQRWHLMALKEALVVSLAFDFVFLVFVTTSPLVRDVFQDFPPAE